MQIGHFGHLRTQCPTNMSTLTADSSIAPIPAAPMAFATLIIFEQNNLAPPSSSTPIAFAVATSTITWFSVAIGENNRNDPSTPVTNTTINTTDAGLVTICPHSYRTFSSHLGLAGHSLSHQTVTVDTEQFASAFNALIASHSHSLFLYCYIFIV
ncbi:unnamed protein product [Schistocephalus solidus]|uniref:C2H2-type domain-containing protein n=1 Tax=Schistocephalus solidus TaxID=70667 RepID=A0A183TRA4_SCHSO|nr:unnamed protein product [Schistocephalus solidus]